MENNQDNKIMTNQRQMIESGVKFRELILKKAYAGKKPEGFSPDVDGDADDITGGFENPDKTSGISISIQKTRARLQNIMRVISIILLCAVSLTFYSTLLASKLRIFLTDGISTVLVYDLFGLSKDGRNYNSINPNPTILNLIGATLKKPITFMNSLYNSEKTSDDDSKTPYDSQSSSFTESLQEDSSSVYYPIVNMDLSSKADGGLTFHNETTYSPDAEALLASTIPIIGLDEIYAQYGDDAPVVLIIHTHGTEAYSPENSTKYIENEGFRSEDITQNVVSVGAVMAEVFNDNGINTIHCTIMHDKDSYRDSYIRSLETLTSFIEKYPSIQYIFDVHRDSIITSDMKCVSPVTNIDGTEAAQFMTVVGTDFKGANHPDWEKNNLTLAVHLQDSLAEKYPNLVRSINLRGAGFNAQYAPGSLLLEIGTCGNTLTQAKTTAKIVANALSELIIGGKRT